jgi:hypothetical protein
MPRYRRYKTKKLDVAPAGERPASWTFARDTVSGSEFAYLVRDRNVSDRQVWEFLVRVPNDREARIEVRPRTVPNVRVWAGLERRSLTFTRARRRGYEGRYYCQIALADPTGERTKDVIRGDERRRLPSWFEDFGARLREKATVRATKGFDADQLVAIVGADEHQLMIGLFFATKVWVLKEAVRLD